MMDRCVRAERGTRTRIQKTPALRATLWSPPAGSFLLAQSQLKPNSDHAYRLLSPTLPASARFCLRFYFSLKGEPLPPAAKHQQLPAPL